MGRWIPIGANFWKTEGKSFTEQKQKLSFSDECFWKYESKVLFQIYFSAKQRLEHNHRRLYCSVTQEDNNQEYNTSNVITLQHGNSTYLYENICGFPWLGPLTVTDHMTITTSYIHLIQPCSSHRGS